MQEESFLPQKFPKNVLATKVIALANLFLQTKCN